ncbi:lamin tail domain-containing protein [Nonlabens antarcticus]|uniref:lamin tail domain-containing protein n=1 Tax=Nonlabens antarcticus TaxID=392714 RepID=UPI001890D22E|nr:lamin tail domain-containing protein [Nonlabens antarcticus]
MKQTYFLIVSFLITAVAFAQQPLITGILDGSCSGGEPKVVEIFADGAVDFTLYSAEKSSNGGTFGTIVDLSFFETVTNDFVYLVNNKVEFQAEFPDVADANILQSGTASINGDDPVRIILTSSGDVVDQYGFVDSDNEPFNWNYMDSFAKRINGTGPDATFIPDNWNFNAANTLDNQGLCNGGTLLSAVIDAGSYNSTATTNPTIKVNAAITGLSYFENNGPSNEDSFSLSAMNLTGNVTVTSSIFRISLTSGSGYTTSIAVSPTTGTVPSTIIYVRLPAGLSPDEYAETIMLTSPGAIDKEVNVSGTVTADDPQVTITANLDNLQYSVGNGPSEPENFSVSGLFLDTDGITVTVPNPFEISTTAGGTYSQTLSFPANTSGTVASTDIFIRLNAGQNIGDYTVALIASATGANDQSLNVSGSVSAAVACASEGSIIITEIMKNPQVVGDNTGEYFELYNTTSDDIDLQSWVIKDDATGSEMHVIENSVIIAAGQYILLARSSTDNGGLSPAYVYGGTGNVSLGNGTDGLIIECNGATVDQVIYNNSTFPNDVGKSMELAATKLGATDNDNGVNWGSATTTFGAGDFGTPGTINDFTLSIKGIQKLTFSLYPNPVASGVLNIQSSNGSVFDVTIYSTLGQQVIFKKSVTSSINIDNLASGLYIVKIVQGDNSQTRKLIVN